MKKCFVIMGYGEKTDYTNGNLIDLDKTYNHIIKPTVESLNIECKRADEVLHCGNIDISMYENLMDADIVIADLSTYNVNAIYELGIRHVLKPYTTIIIAEMEFKNPFDLNHIIIRQYEHLGKDIGFGEVGRFSEELKKAINEILKSPKIDSPIYTYLHSLHPPFVENQPISFWRDPSEESPAPLSPPSASFKEIQTKTKGFSQCKSDHSLKEILELGRAAIKNDNFEEGKKLFSIAAQIDKKNDYIIQKLTLCTYKNPIGGKIDNLNEALELIKILNPEKSNDPETLGLSGAIHKRLWEESNKPNYLSRAISFYERGFFMKQDYYNGINLAFLLNIKATLANNREDFITDTTLAKRIREKVILICQDLLNKKFEERNDKYWILATLEEAYYGLNDEVKYKLYKAEAIKYSPDKWPRKSTEDQLTKLNTLLKYEFN